jgi:hypothetical protein
VILKRKNLPKEKLIFKYNEKRWLIKEIMSDWPRQAWNRRPGALLNK